ncbi:MAG: radical SAM protein [Gemmatimonadetes bacterium]|nr:radical SAM protein [Gemmatimonadota bacterium]
MSTLHVGHLPDTAPGSALGGSAAGITFGPLPSRRFGRSLGVNNLKPKVCTYSCAYCQLGFTVWMGTERRPFHGSEAVARAVRRRVDEARRSGEHIDHIVFVPGGESTLDEGLGRAIHVVRPLGIPVAVVTNGSLLTTGEVREALSEADRVCLKVDAVREEAWRRVNRPHRRLELDAVLDGMRAFAAGYGGTLSTETVLVDGANDAEAEVRATALFVASLHPATAYLSVPTWPTAEDWVRPPSEAVLARAWEVFRASGPSVELLAGYEGDALVSTGDPERDLLSFAAVHPMREMAVRHLLKHSGARWGVVSRLLERRALVEVRYGPHRYYLRPVREGAKANAAGDSGALRAH